MWGTETSTEASKEESNGAKNEPRRTGKQCSRLENPRDRGEPGGLPAMGSHRVGHDGSDLAAAAAAATGSPQKDLDTSLGGERMDPANHLTSG